MTKYTNSIGVKVPALLLPRPGVDMTKWAVVACDQFTSEPEYWQAVEQPLWGTLPARCGSCCPNYI